MESSYHLHRLGPVEQEKMMFDVGAVAVGEARRRAGEGAVAERPNAFYLRAKLAVFFHD